MPADDRTIREGKRSGADAPGRPGNSIDRAAIDRTAGPPRSIDRTPGLRTLKLIVEYDGTGLSGWQRQKNGPSVQEHLETAVAHMVGEPTTVIGASRTDAGVHAAGQVAHFRTARAISAYGFRRGLNTWLPPQIAVADCEEADEGFHARFSARGKHYRYLLSLRPERSPLHRHRAWHRPRTLDLAAMREAATALVGENDFSAFRAAGCTATTTTRKLHAIELSRVAPQLLAIDVFGDAFLRNMVRILAGTLVDVGEGRLAAAQLLGILAGGDRTRAGQTAPAHGLTLMRVFYDRAFHDPDFRARPC